MSRSIKVVLPFSGCCVHGIRWNIFIFTTAVVLLFFVGTTAQSQSTFATITGTVADSSGALVNGVKVVVKNVGTGVEMNTTSNEAGDYTVAQLIPGTYSVTASTAGFRQYAVQGIVLASFDFRRIDVTLEVGNVQTAVEVKAGASLIETETARIDDSKEALVIKDLPFNTRSTWALMALTPNVLQAGGGSSTIRFAGSTTGQNNFAVDGITFYDGVSAQIGPINNYLEWVQEVRLDVGNNTAEFDSLGQMTLISKTGNNGFHGSVVDYYSTPVFLARNPFALARGTGVSHNPGFAVGGPIYLPKIYNGKDKTFFFLSQERPLGTQPPTVVTDTLPLASWRAGDFSALSTAIYDPTNRAPFPGNIIPSARINSVAQTLQQQFYPLPNYGSPTVLQSQNFRENLIYPFKQPDWTVRIDHRFSPKDSIFGSFRYDQQTYGNWQPTSGPLPVIGLSKNGRPTRIAGFSYTHIFTPTLLNEFRYGLAYNNIPNLPPMNGPAEVQKLGLTGLAPNLPDVPGLPTISFSGIALTGISESANGNPSYLNLVHSFQDNVSWFRGRHDVKMGIEVRRVEYDNYVQSSALFGSMSFSTQYSSGGVSGQGNPYADFLLGLPTTSSIAYPALYQKAFRWQYAGFVQDDFKVNPKLTLYLGVRYEVLNPWQEDNNRISMFDIATGEIVVPDSALSQVSPLIPSTYVKVEGAKAAGLPESLIRADKNNFAPRLGVAYRPWGTKTVFRSGFGVYYDILPQSTTIVGVPFLINQPAFTNTFPTPTITLPQVFPSNGTGGPSTVTLPSAPNPNIKIPYSMQYNFTIEHEEWGTAFRASYIGTATRQGVWGYNYNSPLPSTVPFVNKPRPFPLYPGITYLSNGSTHDYNGLTLTAERHLANGLYFQSAFTWARDVGTDLGGASAENPFSLQRDYGVALDIPTFRFNDSMSYQLPFGKGQHFLSSASRLLNAVIGGWGMSAIYSYYSGQFLTPSWTGPDPTNTAYTTSTTPATVTIRPNEIGNPNTGPQTVQQWFNPAAFTAPSPGQFGTSAVGVIKGPHVNNWDTGLFKAFTIREHARLRFEMTATNVFNHNNWSNPGTNISTLASVGVITGVGGVNGSSTGDKPGPRTLRAGVRLEW